MIRKVKFPLKLKLNLIIAGLILFSITIYISFALDLFKKDKSAYIYETALLNAENLAGQLNAKLKDTRQTLNVLAKTYESNPKLMGDIFKSYSNIMTFSIYQHKKIAPQRISHLSDKTSLSKNNLPGNHFSLAKKINPIPFTAIRRNMIYVGNHTIPGGIPHFLMGIYRPKKGKYYIARFLLSDIVNILAKGEIYQSFVVAGNGKLFLDNRSNEKDEKKIFMQERNSSKIISSGMKKGVKELQNKENEPILTAFTHISDYDLYVISEIEKKKAFQAADYLVYKSIYLGIFVLSISVITGIFFARTQTNPIDKLFKATKKIAEGDFSSKVSIESQDEIGSLADSFNYMSEKIELYTEEMKKKALLEKELAVAKLVQDSFFPQENLKLPFLNISSFYTPAAECGGDWWGYIKNDDRIILIIADATGHGVSSAFMTATASCCANNLELIKDKKILNSPARILSFMNHAVSSVAEDILMTCFVALLDPKKLTIKYSNASHNPPLVYRPEGSTAKKENFHPLLDARGPRLGHKKDAVFKEKEVSISNESTLVFFTDGITECVNNAGKQWGERKFLKSLINHIDKDIEQVRDNLIADIKGHAEERPFEDDITLVISRISI